MSRSLLEAMDRFVLDGSHSGNGNGRKPARLPAEAARPTAASYAATARS
jgi:hypothetical protein